MIYVWNENKIKQTLNCHAGGFVGALSYSNNKLYSGGKDGNVCVTDVNSMQVVNTVNFGALIRAIDVREDNFMVVGLKTGSIIEHVWSSG